MSGINCQLFVCILVFKNMIDKYTFRFVHVDSR